MVDSARRRVVINRREIVYGQTPRGLRRKELIRMAVEQNIDVSTLCCQIISLTNKERFSLIKTYYKKLNDDVNEFFTNFDNYEIRSAPVHKQIQNRLNHENLEDENSEDQEKDQKKIKISTLENNDNQNNITSYCESNFIKSEERVNNSTSYSMNYAISENLSFTQSASTSSTCNNIYNNCTKKNLVSQPLIPRNIKSASDADYSDEYESIITSILFQDSGNKLKKIVKEKTNKNKSPKKYNTTMESLLFG